MTTCFFAFLGFRATQLLQELATLLDALEAKKTNAQVEREKLEIQLEELTKDRSCWMGWLCLK